MEKKKSFLLLVEPRLGLHVLPNAVDLARFTGHSYLSDDIVLSMIKILFIQKFEVFLSFIFSVSRELLVLRLVVVKGKRIVEMWYISVY